MQTREQPTPQETTLGALVAATYDELSLRRYMATPQVSRAAAVVLRHQLKAQPRILNILFSS